MHPRQNRFSESQNRFFILSSLALCFVFLTNHHKTKLGNGPFVEGALGDLKKVFDRVDHEILAS